MAFLLPYIDVYKTTYLILVDLVQQQRHNLILEMLNQW